jgi:hypothetical protein
MDMRAAPASGVKVAQHPKGLTLMPAPGGGARWLEAIKAKATGGR